MVTTASPARRARVRGAMRQARQAIETLDASTTSLVMFDPDRTPPALLVPGRRVRFVAA